MDFVFTADDIERIPAPAAHDVRGVDILCDFSPHDYKYPQGWPIGAALAAVIRQAGSENTFSGKIVQGVPDPCIIALMRDIHFCAFGVNGEEVSFSLLLRPYAPVDVDYFRRALRSVGANEREMEQALRVAYALDDVKIFVYGGDYDPERAR